MWRCRKMEAHSLSQMLIQCSDLLQKREKILWYCCQMQLFRHSKANSARTIPIDWKRDYYRLKWPSNEGTRFGSIGKHLERNNWSRNAGDGISLIESRSSRKNNNIISTLVGGCQIQCMGRFYEGGRAKRSETFMQIWFTWKTRSPVDFLHKAQKWFSLWVNSEEYAGMWVIVITAQSTSSNTSDTYNPRDGGWSAITTARLY